MLNIDLAICLHHIKRAAPVEDLKQKIEMLGIPFIEFLASDSESSIYQIDYIDEPNPDISRWNHGVHKDRHYNAFCCHKEMIKIAIANNKQNILILEDDAYITDRFNVVINELSPDLEKLNWDILYLGWWQGEDGDEFNNKIENDYKDGWIGVAKAGRIGGLHGALINQSLFELVLNLPPVDPIDCQLNKYHHNINSYYILPKIIHVRNMPSRCDGNLIRRNQI